MTDLVQTRIPAIQKSICEGDLVESTALTGTPASGSEGASGRACGGSLPVPASHLRKTILGEGAAALGMKNTELHEQEPLLYHRCKLNPHRQYCGRPAQEPIWRRPCGVSVSAHKRRDPSAARCRGGRSLGNYA